MRIREMLTAVALAAGIGGLIAPALAQTQSEAGNAPDQGMNMGRSMDHGMMGGRVMNGGMMTGGCAGMMRSMSGGGRPNSQWHTHHPSDAKPG